MVKKIFCNWQYPLLMWIYGIIEAGKSEAIEEEAKK